MTRLLLLTGIIAALTLTSPPGSGLPATPVHRLAVADAAARGLPDLTPTRIWADRDTCRLWVEWKNKGAAAQQAPLDHRITLSGSFSHGTTPLKKHSFLIHSGAPMSAQFTRNTEAVDRFPFIITGTTLVLFTVDAGNSCRESDEGNNSMSMVVSCQRRQTGAGEEQ